MVALPGPPPSIGQAFFWQAGEARLLPKLQPSPQTYARSINDSEVIVGFSEGVGVEATALVWLNGNVYSLTELISPDESLRLVRQIASRVEGKQPRADPRRRHRRARARRFRALSAHAGAGTQVAQVLDGPVFHSAATRWRGSLSAE